MIPVIYFVFTLKQNVLKASCVVLRWNLELKYTLIPFDPSHKVIVVINAIADMEPLIITDGITDIMRHIHSKLELKTEGETRNKCRLMKGR